MTHEWLSLRKRSCPSLTRSWGRKSEGRDFGRRKSDESKRLLLAAGGKRAWGRKVSKVPHTPDLKMRQKKSLRKSRYWRDTQWTGDQGETSACVGFAWSGWLSGLPKRQWIDPVGIYRLARLVDEWPGEEDDGTSVRAGADIVSSLGFITEYRWEWTVAGILSTLLEVGPVVVGTNWLTGMMEPDKKHFVSATGDILGGHAYLLTGVDVPKQILRIKNTGWGLDWGYKGHAYISFADMDSLLEEDGEACCGVERLPKTLLVPPKKISLFSAKNTTRKG